MLHCIKDLQVLCILRMDFMSKARITLDISKQKIRLGKLIPKQDWVLYLDMDVTVEPNLDQQITVKVP